jgi:acetyl-CoA carboxylase carboxyl transferase subunit beta
VYKAIFGEDFPEGVQTAENLYRCGLIDAVLPLEKLADEVDRVLNVLMAPMEPLPDDPGLDPADSVADADQLPDISAWDLITRSRNPNRPGIRRMLRYGATDVVRLQGTGEGEHDPGLVLALARFGGAPCVFLGQDRRGQSEENPMGPAALAAARRGIRLSRHLGLPLVTLIDTRGAALTREAEERGLAGEIARTLADIIDLPAPTISVLVGEGTGGGALALVPADRMIAAQHGWLSPLPPEGASAIVHRTIDRAPEMAAAQGIRARDLLARGIVDHVVVERPDAADEPEEFCRRMGRVLAHELLKLMAMDPEERYAARLVRLRHLGE